VKFPGILFMSFGVLGAERAAQGPSA